MDLNKKQRILSNYFSWPHFSIITNKIHCFLHLWLLFLVCLSSQRRFSWALSPSLLMWKTLHRSFDNCVISGSALEKTITTFGVRNRIISLAYLEAIALPSLMFSKTSQHRISVWPDLASLNLLQFEEILVKIIFQRSDSFKFHWV